MAEILECRPIGYFYCRHSERYMAPKQAELGGDVGGHIVLHPNFNFEQAVADLVGFDHIWLLYWFHRNTSWKPKVLTPRGGQKRSLFATRSPHRPNPIGLSCVPLLAIQGREIYVGKNDLLDGTPILDIKPYLTYADAFLDSRQGWVEEEKPEIAYQVIWSDLAKEQAAFIEEHTKLALISSVNLRLTTNPLPFPSHRITKISENRYELAFKTWRLLFDIEGNMCTIHKIYSGYDQETLSGNKPSRWDDVGVHQKFIERNSKSSKLA
jgi:tRNA (adenine37-N6)-methyltransferase